MELSYENADALVRTISGTSAEHLGNFVGSLISKQYSVSYVCQLAQHALAFGRWCEARNISLHTLSEDDIVQCQRFRGQRQSQQEVLDRTTPPNGRPGRYRPEDRLLAFLKGL